MSTRFCQSLDELISLVTSQQDYPGKPDGLRKGLVTLFLGGLCYPIPEI